MGISSSHPPGGDLFFLLFLLLFGVVVFDSAETPPKDVVSSSFGELVPTGPLTHVWRGRGTSAEVPFVSINELVNFWSHKEKKYHFL